MVDTKGHAVVEPVLFKLVWLLHVAGRKILLELLLLVVDLTVQLWHILLTITYLMLVDYAMRLNHTRSLH